MSSIDDIKEKLTDMEYKNICDKMMDLHKQFKEQPSVEPRVIEHQIEEALETAETFEPSDEFLREKLSQWYVEDVEHKLQERMSEVYWVEMRMSQMMFNKLLPIRTQLERDVALLTGLPYHEFCERQDTLYDAYHEKEVGFINEASAMRDEFKQEYYQRFPDSNNGYRGYISDDSDIDL